MKQEDHQKYSHIQEILDGGDGNGYVVNVDALRKIADMISQAQTEHRKESAATAAGISRPGETGVEAKPPGPLTARGLRVVLLAVATQRPISWRHAWSLIHSIVVLEEELAKPRECCCEERVKTQGIAGQPKKDKG